MGPARPRDAIECTVSMHSRVVMFTSIAYVKEQKTIMQDVRKMETEASSQRKFDAPSATR